MNKQEIKAAYEKLTADLVDEGHEIVAIVEALVTHGSAIQAEVATTGTIATPNASATTPETDTSGAATATANENEDPTATEEETAAAPDTTDPK
jgi:hypothetical protein